MIKRVFNFLSRLRGGGQSPSRDRKAERKICCFRFSPWVRACSERVRESNGGVSGGSTSSGNSDSTTSPQPSPNLGEEKEGTANQEEGKTHREIDITVIDQSSAAKKVPVHEEEPREVPVTDQSSPATTVSVHQDEVTGDETIEQLINEPLNKPISDQSTIKKLSQKKKQYLNVASDIDEQIVAIQRSARTTIPQMAPLHNYLRIKYKWYHKWHMWKYASMVHWIVLALIIIAGLVIGWQMANNKKPVWLAGAAVDPTKQDFSSREDASFSVNTHGLIGTSDQKEQKGAFRASKGTISVSLVSKNSSRPGQINIEPIISAASSDKGDFAITLPKRFDLPPGSYTLEVTISDGVNTQTTTQDFTWGVLALNFDQSTYKTGENANIGIGVLDDNGVTQCDAKVKFEITSNNQDTRNNSQINSNPNNQTLNNQIKTFSTEDGTIKVSDTCANGNVTDKPDYYTSFTPDAEGQYQAVLTAVTKNGERTMTETFEAKNDPDFVVKRHDTSMRIWVESEYTTHTTIAVNKDVENASVTEQVPNAFETKNYELRIKSYGSDQETVIPNS